MNGSVSPDESDRHRSNLQIAFTTDDDERKHPAPVGSNGRREGAQV